MTAVRITIVISDLPEDRETSKFDAALGYLAGFLHDNSLNPDSVVVEAVGE